MAQALGSLLVDVSHWGEAPVFDGLRGLDEVRYAAHAFPAWRFVALGAPDAVFGGDPSCWYPATTNAGSTSEDHPADGRPGRPRTADAGPGSRAADRRTARRVSPARSSLSSPDEKIGRAHV